MYNNIFILGITGGTGAGKSTVSNLFREKGVLVLDADKIARKVVETGSNCLKELTNEFGKKILNENNSLNRSALGEIVFSDDNKLKILDSITHKYIYQDIINLLLNTKVAVAAIDGAVIINSPVMKLCDAIVVVTADSQVREERIIKRDNINKKTAQNRIKSQMKNNEYIKYADYIINNNGDINQIGEKIEQICSEIKTKSETKRA